MFQGGGFNSPTRFEADVYDCEVWGQIPSDIEGTFYRVQCDFQYRPPQNEWPTGFNGDGHVSAFRFANGSVDFKSRYVKTERLMTERKARKRLWGVYRNPYTDDPSVANIDRGAANTHIYWHGGKMIVLKEDSLPYAIDPHSLEFSLPGHAYEPTHWTAADSILIGLVMFRDLTNSMDFEFGKGTLLALRADPAFRLSLGYIIPGVLLTAGFFLFVVGKGLRAQKLPVQSGREVMIGKIVPALAPISAAGGKVFIEGETWNAVSDDAIEKDAPVEVVAVEGLTLKVRRRT